MSRSRLSRGVSLAWARGHNARDDTLRMPDPPRKHVALAEAGDRSQRQLRGCTTEPYCVASRHYDVVGSDVLCRLIGTDARLLSCSTCHISMTTSSRVVVCVVWTVADRPTEPTRSLTFTSRCQTTTISHWMTLMLTNHRISTSLIKLSRFHNNISCCHHATGNAFSER